MKITSLQTEYFSNPLGLGETQPRFFWRLESDRAGARQVAYRLITSSSAESLENAPDWDSGWVQTNASTHVAYEGAALTSRQRVFWQVEVEDESGERTLSDVAWFEMGLLQLEDWSAQWIETPLAGGPQTTAPVPCLKKEFGLNQSAEEIASARLYITALGIYECHFNGQRVGDHELAPGWTEYERRVRYCKVNPSS